jgi:hypothetical protein
MITETAPDGQFGSSGCVSGFAGEEISLTCPGNRVAIEAVAPAAARWVQVRFADGRTSSSRVAQVPARDGGPFGVYFQAFPASPARPVTLTERDARGRKLGRVHNLESHGSCDRGPYASSPTSEERASTGPHA